MKTSFSKDVILLPTVIILGFLSVYLLSNYLEANQPELPDGYADQDLSLQGARLKGYSLGFDGLLADWYWMRSLQYIGDKIFATDKDVNLEDLTPLNPRLLYPLLDNATTLDPRFMTVYSYGAVVLPAIDPQQAIKIAKKGIKNNPKEWRLYQHLGYIYWRLKNYGEAAGAYETGSLVEGAPSWMKSMAAKMNNEGGSREIAREIYRQMLEEAGDTQTRENALLRLQQLDSLDEMEVIGVVLSKFKEQNGRCVNSWKEIFPLLRLEKLPGGKDFRIDKSGDIVDPSGVPYILDAEKCEVTLDVSETKIPRV